MFFSKEGQLNTVFALFGYAAFQAARFEESLFDLLTAYRELADIFRSMDDSKEQEKTAEKEDDIVFSIEASFENSVADKLDKKTIGVLLCELKKHISINDRNVNETLSTAKDKRNFLIHRYFRERKEEFDSESGRLGMIKELHDIASALEKATGFINGMRVALERLNK